MTARRHEATQNPGKPMDWATLGARVLEVATMASVVHRAERAWATHDGRMVQELSAADGRSGERTEPRLDGELC